MFTKPGYLVCLTSLLALFCYPRDGSASDKYGAIAYSEETGHWGTAYDYSSQAAAEESALRRCGSAGCRIVLWFRNACGALAVGDDGTLGWGWAGSRARAEVIALTECSARGSGCRILCWACTSR